METGTTAHCSAPRADYAIFIGADYNDAAARAAQGNLVAVTEHHAHPNYDSSTNENDIGVLITTDPIARAPAAINRRGLAKSDIGKPIRIVGYGQTSGDSKAMGRRTQGTTTIADFDPTTLTVRNVPNICLNDSGGPTFMTREGEEVVVGIHFIIDSAKCDGEGLDMRVDGYTDFVDGYIQSNDPPRSGDGSAEDDAGAPREASPSAAETTPPAAPASGCVLGRARTASGDALLVALIATALLVVRKRSAHRGRTRISSGAAGTPGPA